MARLKNVERKHFVQAYKPGTEEPGEDWLPLAHLISNIGDDTQEGTEEEAFYDGDGTPETTVTSIAQAYTPEGYYDSDDPAQELIAGLKFKTGDGRKLWHRVVRSDGKMEWVGRATATAIIAGAGEASAYEEFSCNIRYDQIPEQTDLTEEDESGE